MARHEVDRAAVQLFPDCAGFLRWRMGWRLILPRIVLLYAAASLFPLISTFAVPNAPTVGFNNLILHHSTFFTPADALLADPLVNLRDNWNLLREYLAHYLTNGITLLAMASTVFLGWRKRWEPLLCLTLCIPPLLFQALVLEYYPSRYVFPHVWPGLVVVAVAAASWERRWVFPLASLVVLAWTGVRSTQLLEAPRAYLHPDDAEEYLGSGAFAGFGVREAVEYLRSQASAGPFVLLTDPIWGTPADAMYVYLSGVSGITLYDAWWLQDSTRRPILPEYPIRMMKSQYERVSVGVVSLHEFDRVFYVTDTNYSPPGDVKASDPGAVLVASFPKPGARQSIDVYRLK